MSAGKSSSPTAAAGIGDALRLINAGGRSFQWASIVPVWWDRAAAAAVFGVSVPSFGGGVGGSSGSAGSGIVGGGKGGFTIDGGRGNGIVGGGKGGSSFFSDDVSDDIYLFFRSFLSRR